MATNGVLDFQSTNKLIFRGTSANVVIDTQNLSLGVGHQGEGAIPYKLHVTGDANGSTTFGPVAGLGFEDSGVSFCGIKVGEKGDSPYSRTALSVEDNGNTILHVDGQNQRIGIGTTTPAGKLEIGHYGSAIGDLTALCMTNHATNLHGTVLTEYNLVVSDIAAGTGLGNGVFSIAYRANKTDSLSHRLTINGEGYIHSGNGITSRTYFHHSDNVKDSTNGAGHGKMRIMMNALDPTQSYHGNEYGMELGVSGSGNSVIQTIGYTHNTGETAGQYNLGLQPFSGNVGVGTYSPLAKLQVSGTGDVNMAPSDRQYFRYDYNSAFGATAPSSGYGWGHCSIYASGAILSGDHVVSTNGVLNSSDERIKKNIVDADDAECLEVLRQLKPKKYQYKDEIKNGQEPVWGFIAQEVRETLPYATQLRMECIPNIYELANVSDSRVITFINFDTSDLESNAMVLKVFDKNDTEHLVNIAEVVDEHTIRVEEDLSEWTDTIEESEGDKIFVFGQQVGDFVFIKKDAIWTVATAALQEVDRQLQAEKARNDALEARIAALENNISS